MMSKKVDDSKGNLNQIHFTRNLKGSYDVKEM